MEREEINKYIHVEIMGKCWHNSKLQPCHQAPNTGSQLCNEKHWYCIHCGIETSSDGRSDGPPLQSYAGYCSDDSPRRLLNEVVAKVTVTTAGWNLFHCALVSSLKGVQMPWGSTAEQIATACVKAHKAAKESK